MLGSTKCLIPEELYVMLPNFKQTHLSRKQTILLFKKVSGIFQYHLLINLRSGVIYLFFLLLWLERGKNNA